MLQMTWNLTFSFQTSILCPPFPPPHFPLGQLRRLQRIPSFALSLPVLGRQRCKRRLDTTTTPHNSSHPLKPTHSLHYQAHHSSRSAKGTSHPAYQGLVFSYFCVFSATKWDSCAIPPMRHQDITQQTLAVFSYEVATCGWPIDQ